MFGFYRLFVVIRTGDFNLAFANYFSKAHHHVNLVFAHQELYAFAHLVGYATAAFDHRRKVLLAAGFNTKILCMLNVFHNLRTFQQGFGWNTTPVQANAAEAFFFNNAGLKTQLRRANGGHIPTRTAANYNYIVCHDKFRFTSLELRFRQLSLTSLLRWRS